MKTGYLLDSYGEPFCNTNHIRYIVDDEGKPLQDILNALADIKRAYGVNNFPIVGKEDHLYIDTENGGIYLWDATLKDYFKIMDKGISDSSHTHSNKDILDKIKYALTEELKSHYDSAIQTVFIGEQEQVKEGNIIRIPQISGAVSSVLNTNLPPDKVIISNNQGKLEDSLISTQELESLSGTSKNIQKHFTQIESDLNTEFKRAVESENQITNNLTLETSRATEKENELNENLSNESTRAKQAESDLSSSISNEILRAKNAEATLSEQLIEAEEKIQLLKETDIELENVKANIVDVNQELDKRYIKDQVYTKEEALSLVESYLGHPHANKDVLDQITQTNYNAWNTNLNKMLFLKNITVATSSFSTSTRTATISNSAFKSTQIPTVIFSQATRDIAMKANILAIANNGSLSLIAKKIPTQNLVIDVIQLTETT